MSISRAQCERYVLVTLSAAMVSWLALSAGCSVTEESLEGESESAAADAIIVGSRIQAETWAASGTTGVFNEGGGEGQSVAGFQVSETIRYTGVNFGGANQIQFNLGAPYGGGTAEIWADAVGSGTRLGTISMGAATGDWSNFAVRTASITPISGTHDLYLKGVATGGDWLFKLDWFELYTSGTSTGSGAPPSGNTIPVRVTNSCPFPLHVAVTDQNMIGLERDGQGNNTYRQLTQGQSFTYQPPNVFPGGRVSAYKTPPTPASPRELEKAEFTLEKSGSGVEIIHYNVTYVDHLGLPVRVSAAGSGAGCVQVGCNLTASQASSAISTSCPDGLTYSMGGGTICLAPRSFCLDGEYASDGRRASVCSRLDGEVARCQSKYPGQCNPGSAKTPQVYACSPPFFDQSPKFCAALNRGMLDNPDSTNVASYYTSGKPFNLYSKWIHDKCGALYAFPYDDFPSAANQAGLYGCDGATQFNVTFCPNG